jgi:hypothetical protein
VGRREGGAISTTMMPSEVKAASAASLSIAAATTRRRNNGSKNVLEPPTERYYHILQAILEGNEKSWFYQQKLILDPRPTFRVIESTPDTPNFHTLKRDMNELINEGLVSAEYVKRKLKWAGKQAKRKGKKPAREFIPVYSVTAKGMEFLNHMKKFSEEEGRSSAT